MPADVYLFFLLPVYLDFITIMLWLHSVTILETLEGKPITPKMKKAFIAAWLGCRVLAITVLAVTPVL